MELLKCPRCGNDMYIVYSEISEYNKYGTPTGRSKRIANYLLCEYCGKKETIDDSFDIITKSKG